MPEQRGSRWREALVPLACATAGFAAGAIFGGGKLVRVYDWETEWNVDAPRAEVFRALNAPAEQAEQKDNWWPSMAVERAEPLPDNPKGHSVTYRVTQAPSVRRFAPAFVIRAVTADVERDRRMRSVVTGDLAGVLETLLYDRPDGGTRVVFHWYVRVTNPVLNALGYVLEPMFRKSHDHVMREGEAGLQAYCATDRGHNVTSPADTAAQPTGR